MIAVETNRLTKRFNGFKAVDSLELKVPEGSVYGFLGPNGAGKTTTIKMLTGLSRPSEGEIRICGKEVRFGNPGNRTDIGFLPDVPSFYNWMRAEEYLRFSGGLFGIDKKTLDGRTDSLLDLVGLKGVSKKIGAYSRGMKQRLGIAQALINQPSVVFLDEPTSALDPIGRKEVIDIIARLSGKVTVFFSTHILSDIERVCDRVVILNKGRKVIEDTIDNLRTGYSRRGLILEVDAGSDRTDLMDILARQEWVEELTADGSSDEIRIFARDLRKAQVEIPGILNKKGIPLKRFALLEPTLEDIFMKVVNE